MATQTPVATRNAMVDAATALLDAGAGPGYVEIRTGSQPGSADDPASGDLLATIQLEDPAFTPSSSGSASAAVTDSVAAIADGEAGWFRAYDSAGNVVLDGAVGIELLLNTPTIVNGTTVSITSWTISANAVG